MVCEDVLKKGIQYFSDVLILVLVEDGLRDPGSWHREAVFCSLNPCFSGRWSASIRENRGFLFIPSCLNPCFSGRWSASTCTKKCWRCLSNVLILVLVEDGLREKALLTLQVFYTVLILVLVEDGLRDNTKICNQKFRGVVLILVLVEDGLRGTLNSRY